MVPCGIGLRPLLAHSYLGLGTLYRRGGAAERARQHMTTATTIRRDGNDVLAGEGAGV